MHTTKVTSLSLEVFHVDNDLEILVPYDLKPYADCDKNTFRENLLLVILRLISYQYDSRTFHLILDSFVQTFRIWKCIVSSLTPKA